MWNIETLAKLKEWIMMGNMGDTHIYQTRFIFLKRKKISKSLRIIIKEFNGGLQDLLTLMSIKFQIVYSV